MGFYDLIDQCGAPGRVRKYDQVYRGEVRLSSLSVSLPPQTRVLEMVAPYPKLSIDVLVEVLTVEGFTSTGNPELMRQARALWQSNRMDTGSKLTMTDSLVRGQAFLSVTKDVLGRVRYVPRSLSDATVVVDDYGDVVEGLWRFTTREGVESAIYYTPGINYLVEKRGGRWVTAGANETGISVPTLIPFTNRNRIEDTYGVSDLEEILGITDAGSRSLTNLQVAQELLAMPVRGLFGDGVNEAFGDKNKFDVIMSGLITGPAGAELKQLPGADLGQIINSIRTYSLMASAITGIPPAMLGVVTDTPTSAEAMRAAKERLIQRAEKKQALFGDPFELLTRVGLAMSGVDVSELGEVETVWRDPATPSINAKTANMLQAQAQGVISAETARDFLALSPEQKARENARALEVDSLERAVDEGEF